MKLGISLIFIIYTYCGSTYAQDKNVIWIDEFKELAQLEDKFTSVGTTLLYYELITMCGQLCLDSAFSIEMQKTEHLHQEEMDEDNTINPKNKKQNIDFSSKALLKIYTNFHSYSNLYIINTTIKTRPKIDTSKIDTSRNEWRPINIPIKRKITFFYDQDSTKKIESNDIEPLADLVALAIHNYFDRKYKKVINVYPKEIKGLSDALTDTLKKELAQLPKFILMGIVDDKSLDMIQVDTEQEADHFFVVRCSKLSNNLIIKATLENKDNRFDRTESDKETVTINDSTNLISVSKKITNDLIEKLKNK